MKRKAIHSTHINVVVVSHASTSKMSREVANRDGLDGIHVYLVVHREQLLVRQCALIPVKCLEKQISEIPMITRDNLK